MADRNAEPKAFAVALWSFAVHDLGLPTGKALPVDRFRKAIAHFMDVGSSESERRYLELLDRLDLVDRETGFVVLREPDGPIPFLRPPEEMEGGESVTAGG
jgi:hypothetical protein